MEQPGAVARSSYGALAEHLIIALFRAFRRSDLLLRIAAWEVFDPSPVTLRLAAARGLALQAWLERQRGTLAMPTSVDAAAINAVLIASVQHLALSARAIGSFSHVPLSTDADFERIEETLRTLVRASYGEIGS